MGIRHICKRRFFLRWGLRRVRERKSPEKPHNPWHRRDHTQATKYFEAANLDAVQVQPERDLFGDLRRRFPNAWHALSLLSGSSENEIACELPIEEAESMDSSASKWEVQHRNVVASGIDPRM